MQTRQRIAFILFEPTEVIWNQSTASIYRNERKMRYKNGSFLPAVPSQQIHSLWLLHYTAIQTNAKWYLKCIAFIVIDDSPLMKLKQLKGTFPCDS